MATFSNIGITQTTTEMYTAFYNQATIFRPCFFDVGFYGAYVDTALRVMNSNASHDGKLPRIVPGTVKSDGAKAFNGDSGIFTRAFSNFVQNHVDGGTFKKSGNMVRMRWAVMTADVPLVKSEIDTTYSIDAIKPIVYPLVKSYGGVQALTVTIVDDMSQNLFQFFNSLHNAYFNQLELMPKSSLHKCGIWVAASQGGPTTTTSSTKETGGKRVANNDSMDIDLLPVQLYEFNSVTMESMSNMKYTNQIDAKQMTFDVTFKVPNTFQEVYSDTLRGLLDNSSGFGSRVRGGGNGAMSTDGSALLNNGNGTGGGQWNESFFYYNFAKVITDES